MPRYPEPSYTEIVYDVLRGAHEPMTFQQIFDEVDRRRSITTRNPKSTVRNALAQGRQLISLGNGSYGYLPTLANGSLFRIPLTEAGPEIQRLVFPDDARDALWPSFFEIQKRKNNRPLEVRLPTSDEISLEFEFFGLGVWGSSTPENLRQYLVECNAAAGDSLLIRVIDSEKGYCEAQFESQRVRDSHVIARRNRELADAAHRLVKRDSSLETPIWTIAPRLIALGLYRSDIAPDPLEIVLDSDSRFVNSGHSFYMLAENMTPEMNDVIKSRNHWMKDPLVTEGDLLDQVDTRAKSSSLDDMLSDLTALLTERGIDTIDDATRFLQSLMAGQNPVARSAATPLKRAQELIYDAWEEPSRPKRIRLARAALEISEDCADAFCLLAEETARTPEQAADLYARGVSAGTRALGDNMFVNAVGSFWGILDTRPYMRARFGLANALWAMGEREGAIDHLQEMLRLNPGDNQGVRYVLIGWLLETDDDVQVANLLDRYREDIAAIWHYSRALHAFRTKGNTTRTRRLLDDAVRSNPIVPAYLLGKKRLPTQLPSFIGIGDEDEAIYCASEQMVAWRQTDGALDWLKDQTG